MSEPSSILELLDLWPTRRELATEIAASTDRVHKWAQTGSIPAKYHLAIIMAAERRGFSVTGDLLARLHAPQPKVA